MILDFLETWTFWAVAIAGGIWLAVALVAVAVVRTHYWSVEDPPDDDRTPEYWPEPGDRAPRTGDRP